MLYVINSKKSQNKLKKGYIILLSDRDPRISLNDDLAIADKESFKLIFIYDSNVNINYRTKFNDLDDITYSYDLIGECSICRDANGFIIDDAKVIMNDNENSPTYKSYIYYQFGELYIYPEFRDQYFGSYLCKTVCNNIEMRHSSISLHPVIVTKAGALIKEYPNQPSDEECKKIGDKIAKFYCEVGFVSTDDFNKFDTGHGLMYVNKTTAIPLINFYKNKDKYFK